MTIDIELQKEIKAYYDLQLGPSINLSSYAHFDYICDVLDDHFDIDYECFAEDNRTGVCTIHFGKSCDIAKVDSMVEVVNHFHKYNKILYETT